MPLPPGGDRPGRRFSRTARFEGDTSAIAKESVLECPCFFNGFQVA
ncbi:hypothetical protein NG796_07735 [Laspinema sp. A4]|nr:hypothetical protein [Laspinema sp. D2d]MCT7983181.1 hypothetical protein [Laspinema sp. D2d]